MSTSTTTTASTCTSVAADAADAVAAAPGYLSLLPLRSSPHRHHVENAMSIGERQATGSIGREEERKRSSFFFLFFVVAGGRRVLRFLIFSRTTREPLQKFLFFSLSLP